MPPQGPTPDNEGGTSEVPIEPTAWDQPPAWAVDPPGTNYTSAGPPKVGD